MLPANDTIPWELIKLVHVEKYGYSGTMLRALRITRNLSRELIASRLKKRSSYVEKLENTDKIGIKIAKDLADIFGLTNWRILRTKPDNIKFL